jgi:hypothetical protein
MEATFELTHERVDDVPLLLGFLIHLQFPEILDRHLPPHPLHQGLSNGWLITVWIAYILSQADHRKSHVQEWVDALQHTIETIIGQPIRPVEFGDDRLTLVLKRAVLKNPVVCDARGGASPSGHRPSLGGADLAGVLRLWVGELGGLSSDQVGERRDVVEALYAILKITPEGNPQLPAGRL